MSEEQANHFSPEEQTTDSITIPNTPEIESKSIKNKPVSIKQAEHLRNARKAKDEIKKQREQKEGEIYQSLSFIYKRLGNIEESLSYLPTLGKIKRNYDFEEREEPEAKRKPVSVEVAQNPGYLVTLGDTFIQYGVGLAATTGIYIVKHYLDERNKKRRREDDGNNGASLVSENIEYGLPMVPAD